MARQKSLVQRMLHPAANEDMVQGYMDGRDPDTPEPSVNRSHSYRHGFANGRDDLAGKPRASAEALITMANEARDNDRSC